MIQIKNVVIVSASRTPIGNFMGAFKDVPATKLGSIVIESVIRKSNINPQLVDEVILGNVLPANEGQAPARQAALGANLDKSVQCLTINKVCGSGLKSVMLAAQAIMVGDADIIIAGGMENMSRAPYYLPDFRTGSKMGNQQIVDGLIKDGLWDVYNDFHMGNAAELCAESCRIDRNAQDEFAILSYSRAQNAQKKGLFNDEIVAVEVAQRKGEALIIKEDEGIWQTDFEKLKNIKPAFKKEGTVTAANSSSINDGAAALMLMSEEKAQELGLTALVKIVAQSSSSKSPEEFTTAPSDSIKKTLDKADLNLEDIDLFEINEAFAVVALVNKDLLAIPEEKLNINGGAVALGHPIGASGARILVTLLHAMKQKQAKRGLASICIGGGEASTVIVERV
jgi:acetyl-CoA C-acetyltransferase